MARINVEEEFWVDPRLRLLQKAIGEDQAVGQILRLWRLAQERWKHGKLITKEQFEIGEFSEHLFTCKFVEYEGDEIYVKGTREKFDWLKTCREAGKRGGKKKKQNQQKREVAPRVPYPSVPISTPQEIDEKTDQKPDEIVIETPPQGKEATRPVASENNNLVVPSPSSSFSPSCSSSFKEELPDATAHRAQQGELFGENAPAKKTKTPKPDSKTAKVWEAYSEAMKIRYPRLGDHELKRNVKVNSQLSQLIQRLGEHDAIEVVKFYVRHPAQFYSSRVHPIGLCLKDAESLYTQWKMNTAVTNTEARQSEKMDFWRAQMERAERGEM